MFFQENSIHKNLSCKICQKRFQEPVFIPCGETVCERCITDFIEEKAEKDVHGQFKCCLCDEHHSIPAKGFPKSKMAKKLLELKPKQINESSYINLYI